MPDLVAGLPVKDQRFLGEGTTRRFALLLLLLAVAALVLLKRAVVTLTSGRVHRDFLASPHHDAYAGHLEAGYLALVPDHPATPYHDALTAAALDTALLGTALMLLLAAVLFLCGPAWRRRRGRLRPVDAALRPRLLDLTRRAGLARPPRFLVDPRGLAPTAVTFGGAGRYTLCLNAGLCALRHRDRRTFEAVVLHELAHLRNRDVEIGEAARALWWAFTLVVALPYAGLLAWLWTLELTGGQRQYWPGEQPSPAREALLVAFLVALAHVAHTEILRSRELCADLDAVDWGADPACWDRPATALARSWARLRQRSEDRWRAARALTADLVRVAPWPWSTHPSWRARRVALERPVMWRAGGHATGSQILVFVGTVVTLAYFLLNEVFSPAWTGPVPAVLMYASAVLAWSVGAQFSRHPAHAVRARPRAFGSGATRRARRAALPTAAFALLVLTDPMGCWLRA